MPSLSTTRRLAVFLGMMEISTRCNEIASKAKRSATTTASGVRPRPASSSSIQYPMNPLWNGPR